MGTIIDKREARIQARRIWSGLDASQRLRLEEGARRRAERHSGRIFLTAAMGDELDVLRCLLEGNWDLLLPVIAGNSMHFHYLRQEGRLQNLRTGRFGISEPVDGGLCIPAEGDLMFVPALACNAGRFRLGRGGGFYDRYFAENLEAKKCWKVSVLPVELMEIHFPEQSHDIKLDELVTDIGTVE